MGWRECDYEVIDSIVANVASTRIIESYVIRVRECAV